MHIKELGHVVLYVTNLERSRKFYRDVLGFREIASQEARLPGGQGFALYSSGRTHHEMLLIEIGGTAKPLHAPEPGLYHIGFKIGDSPEDIKNAHQELKTKGITITGTADHTVTHSLYILDPDNNQLELYADVNDSWKKDTKVILTPPKALELK